ncbi:integrase arm-type DNA-binding domain-containing protein [Ruegeria sp.]
MGSYPEVSLEEARQAADNWRAVARKSSDPSKNGNASRVKKRTSCTC